MRKTDALFQLVKSLTRGEKRNFRLLAQLTGGDKKYLRLFDVIDRLEVYEEDKVLKQFRKDEAFVRQFSVNKNYLYHSILNSLSYYRKDTDAESSSLFIQVRILVEKNLFSHARKLLRKLKDKVLEGEQLEELMRLLNVEADLERKVVSNMRLLPSVLKDIQTQEKIALEKLQNLLEYRHLERETAVFTRVQLVARNVKEIKALDYFFSHPLLADDARPLTVRASVLYHEVRRRLALYRSDSEAELKEATLTVEVYDRNPNIKADDMVNYLIRLGMLAKCCFHVNRDDDGFVHLAKIRAVATERPQERLARFEWGSLLHLAVLSSRGAKEEGLEFLQEVERDLDDLQDEMGENPRFMAYYFCAVFYICVGEYSRALKWINRFLNNCDSTFRTDLQSMMRIMNLLVHYELGNRDILEYSIKSTYRFVYKKERMYQYERRILRFYTDLQGVNDEPAYRQLAETVLADLNEIVKDPYEVWASNVFDMPTWLEGRLSGRTMAQVRVARQLVAQVRPASQQ